MNSSKNKIELYPRILEKVLNHNKDRSTGSKLPIAIFEDLKNVIW